MPTFLHGKNADFTLNAVSIKDVLQDISFGRGLDLGETTSFGSNSKTYLAGLQDSTISVSGKYDATYDSNIQTLITNLQSATIDSIAFKYMPSYATPATVSKPRFTGNCIIKSYEVKAGVGDVLSFSLELQVTGAITRETSGA